MRKKQILFLVVAPLLLFGAISLARASEIGFNKFELVQQYLGRASGGDGSDRYQKVTVAMARKAMADARDVGVTFFRVSATGYQPSEPGGRSDLDLWVKDPARHWAMLDMMFADLDLAGLRLVPSFIWHAAQFPAMNNETVRDLVTDPRSRAYQMAERYVREFVQRYRDRKTILFYELTNELNLLADLDAGKRCMKKATSGPAQARCKTAGNFSTDELIAFSKRLAHVIRQVDPNHPISSGFSVPRPQAERLRVMPEWRGKQDPSRKNDSAEEFEKNLIDIHSGVDIISVHLYPVRENARFGSADPGGTALLEAAHAAAQRVGKPLFIGEFGDASRVDGRADAYTVRMIRRIVELKIPYAAVWAWEFYQRTPYTTRDSDATAFSLEPGTTDALLQEIARANAAATGPRRHHPAKDTTPPRLVLTWPLECAMARATQTVHAVASDDSGTTPEVEFFVDDKPAGRVGKPPYQFTIDVDKLGDGEHVLSARAKDPAGNASGDKVTFSVRSQQTRNCSRTYAQ